VIGIVFYVPNLNLAETAVSRPLNKSELDQLEQWRELGRKLCQRYGITGKITPTVLDRLHQAWLNDSGDKLSIADLGNALGTMAGDHLIRRLWFEWCICDYDGKDEYCLTSESGTTWCWQSVHVSRVMYWVRHDVGDDKCSFTRTWKIFQDKIRRRRSRDRIYDSSEQSPDPPDGLPRLR